MKFSKFGQKFTQNSPILQLMADLGEALNSDKPVNMLGGGNPARIPEVDQVFLESLRDLDITNLADAQHPVTRSMGNYASPQGDADFIKALVDFLNKNYATQDKKLDVDCIKTPWESEITTENIALTNGSQNAFFCLFNLLSGQFADGSVKKILLPLAPEYVGYNDVHVDAPVGQPHFVSIPPTITEVSHTDSNGNTQDGFFKYSIDFEALAQHPELVAGNIGAICCSRPTNPTGNVLTDAEMAKLSELAKQYEIPLIVDGAYGMPFPNMITTPATLTWDSNTVLCFSLSKIGLPGLRTGIVVADKQVIQAISALNAIVNLAPTNFGAAITTPLLKNNKLQELSLNHIQPFYQQKAEFAITELQKQFHNTENTFTKKYPVKIHKPEGAMFLWIWFDGLPEDTVELYKTLKQAGTLIIPSAHFYVGQDISNFRHAHECIRMSVAQNEETLQKGIACIGEIVRDIYDNV